jgi:hypothetical protein
MWDMEVAAIIFSRQSTFFFEDSFNRECADKISVCICQQWTFRNFNPHFRNIANSRIDCGSAD